MKKKLLAVMLIVVMVLASAVTAFAEEVKTGKGGDGSITVSNASKGETYKLFKLFDAELGANDAIVYTGTIPAALNSVFEKNSDNHIVVKAAALTTAGELTPAAVQTLTTYANGLAETDSSFIAKKVSEGGALVFSELKYGYYVVTSSQGDHAISIDSANKAGTVVDKNFTKPGIVKAIDDNDVYIGQRVEYTLTASTANYMSNNRKVKSYVIEDTLPSFLTDVVVESITVGGQAITPTPQFVDKKIVLNWVDANGDHLYANNAQIVVKYKATVTKDAVLGEEINLNKSEGDQKAYLVRSGNINKVTLKL